MFNRLISFDFDGTLVNTMTPEIGKPKWEKETGFQWPGKGWWSSPESLNTNIFYAPVNKWVHDKFIEFQSNPDNYVFIATGRLKKLEPFVKKVLDVHDIECDLYCNTGGETFNFKRNLFETIININPGAEEFIMYDDRHEHLVKFVEWGKKQSIKVTIIDVLNKKQLL